MQYYSGQQMPGRSGARQLQPEVAANGARQPASESWLIGQTSDPNGAAPSDEDALGVPWAGALGPEDDPDATLAFSGDYPPQRGIRSHPGAVADRDDQGDDWGPTSLQVGPRMAAGISYLFWWVSGLVVYFNERRNKFVRFHAVQSILLTGALTVFGVLAYIASSLLGDVYLNTHQAVFLTLSRGVGWLCGVLIVMLWLAPMIAAWSGEYLRLPIVGEYAERFAALPPQRPTA